MIRYISLLCIYIPFYLLAILLAPLLPLFAEMRDGPIDNNNGYGVEPRLPKWLSWFDTGYDNSLWGDQGWRTKHCPRHWQTYFGMVLWLCRNPAAGFCWKVLSFGITKEDTFVVKYSGNYLDVDKGQNKFGWYYITSSSGAFSLRWCKRVGNRVLNFEAGWLLDIYIKDESAKQTHPLATFQFQPQLKSINREV